MSRSIILDHSQKRSLSSLQLFLQSNLEEAHLRAIRIGRACESLGSRLVALEKRETNVSEAIGNSS